MKQEKNKKIIRIVRPLCMVMLLAVLLGYGTYAWIKRDWYPTLDGQDMTITTGDSLKFQFEDGENYEGTTIKINDLLNMENFVLKSVSSYTGRSMDFFGATSNPSGNNATFNKLDQQDLSSNYGGDLSSIYMELGKKYGYVDVRFRIAAPADGKTRQVYLTDSGLMLPAYDEQTPAQRAVTNSLRVSITVLDDSDTMDSSAEGDHFLFGFEPDNVTQLHSGINPLILSSGSGNRYAVDGESMYAEDGGTERKADTKDGYPIWLTQSEPLRKFSEFTSSNYLFELTPETPSRLIAVRIWLEGEADGCTNAITGQDVPLIIKFSDVATAAN